MSRPLPRDTRLTCDGCGYRTPVTTEAMAAYALRKHSCAMTIERARRAAAAENRRRSSGEVRDCTHRIARHVHGTRNAYVLDRCRCRPCRDATAAHHARVSRAQAYGQWSPFVDATPVREHLAALTAAGLGLRRIADRAGVARSVVSAIVYGKKDLNRPPTRRVRRETAQALLAVRADLDALGASVPVDGSVTLLRLRALVACGWNITELGRRLGITNIHRVLAGYDSGVRADTARKARDLYEELWDVAPPMGDHRQRISASAARNYAAKRGWAKPLDLDDDVLRDGEPVPLEHVIGDEPGVVAVDEVAIDRFIGGDLDWKTLTTDERIAAALRMDRLGYSRNVIADRVHMRSQALWAAFRTADSAAMSEAS